MAKGCLYLIPCNIGTLNPNFFQPSYNTQIISKTTHYIVEREKTTRAFFKSVFPEINQQALNFEVLNKHTKESDLNSFLDPCYKGVNVGLLSEAGVPGVADPGAKIVEIAHRRDLKVIPLVGPSSLLLALMASGLNGQSFAFNGYLPIKQDERKKNIKFFESLVKQKLQTQIFIETPYRNEQLFNDLIKTLSPTTKLCIAISLQCENENIKTKTIAQWSNQTITWPKAPAVFLIGV